jgi:siroheme synthase-like protein
MPLFPAFLKLEGRLILVVGGGAIATDKIPGLLQAGARIRVIAPQITPQIAEWVRNLRVDWLPKPFEPTDLRDTFLVIAATSLRELNRAVFLAAEAQGTLCNAVDDIDHCHFYYGSIVQRGDLQIAISTNGKSPALAQRLRKELSEQFGPEYESWLDWLGAAREVLRSQSSEPEATKHWLHLLASRPSFERFLQETTSGDKAKGGA